MIVHQWGLIEYERSRKEMQEVHSQACRDKQNHLIICSHPNVFTIGSSCKEVFDVATLESDRGGSITCHTPGQNIYYFCFQVTNPARFYKKVLDAFEDFFRDNLLLVFYDKKNPGFYIGNNKIASLGFRYSQGVSLHGVALNVDVDLEFHNRVAPCNLQGIKATSLKNEGLNLTQAQVDTYMIKAIKKSFHETV